MKSLLHESAKYHVTGEAIYIDDMAVDRSLLHGFLYTSPHACAKILNWNTDKARHVEGVHAVLSFLDITGHNDMGPVFHDEPVLAQSEVNWIGQPIFLIAAESEEIAEKAMSLIEINFEIQEPVTTIQQAITTGNLLQPPRKIETGNVDEVFQNCSNIIEGELSTGGQEHWYLETQICLCIPGEGNEIKAYSSTQHPAETQAIISEVLGIPKHEVEVECRRMGGGFGGKETGGNHIAAWTSLLCKATGRPVKTRLFRDVDQKITGKRHPFYFTYKAAYNDEGKILAVDVVQNANGGAATDLTMAILERAMLHAENAYYIPNMRIVGNAWKTNLPSNVAFRGFGGPQGVACMETIIEKVAFALKKDAAEIRYKNFYGTETNNVTPYGETVENNRLQVIWDKIKESSEYYKRRCEVENFNSQNEFVKRGISVTPVKFGISFTTSFLNQAGALVNIYTDGTVLVNHGGTEMGQGLYTKMKRVAALELGVSVENIKVNATNTSKIPNTSATAASSGSDINGMAVKNAVDKLKSRLAEFATTLFNKNVTVETQVCNIEFADNFVFDKLNHDRQISFKELISQAYLNQVSLSATGFYKTPDIYFDRATGKGKPFHYYAFGMAVTEVELDVLTGRVKVVRADILHDVGESIIPMIDIGQVEGAFIQGLGWVTTEDMKYDKNGNLLNHSPDTYKIPTIADIPDDFRVNLLEGFPNPNTIRKSKAVGEPPFMLGLSCWMAIKDAISATVNHSKDFQFDLPATNENILLIIEELKK